MQNSYGDPELFIFIQHCRLRETDSRKCLLLCQWLCV